MNSNVDGRQENLVWSGLYGMGRGASVQILTHPLEVVKIRQQCSQESSKSVRVALTMLQNEGMSAFYKGLAPKLAANVRLVWRWPLMTEVPPILQKHQIGVLSQQALTGFLIATVDAFISQPLERAKILSASQGASKLYFKNVYKDGWKGASTYWLKLCVNWITFLTVQKHLRSRSSESSEQPLSFPQLTKIGMQTALIVSVVSAPFDVINTRKQAQCSASLKPFSRQGVFRLYRGWPLSAFSLLIHNVASVYLLEKLDGL